MPIFGPPARVRPYFGYRNAARLRLTARALRMREPAWEQTGTARKLAAMLRQFASQEVAGLAVTLEIEAGDEAQRFTQHTDAEGYVHFDVPASADSAARADPSWQVARLRWTNREGAQTVPAYILDPGDTHSLAVISDIDDTIVETGAGDLLRNWRRVLAQMPGDREAVPGAAAFYDRLSMGGAGASLAATRRPFFYVSSSPWNLFDYLVAFQKLHKLPQGPILLRDWDFSRPTIGSGGHHAHKARAIAGLVEFYPELRFALIGDNTQADAMAYAEAVRDHPGRIAAVFIRRAPGADLSAEEESALAAIRAAGVPLWSGASYEVGADFLSALGFTAGGETTQIVNTLESAGRQPPA
jgi:phosphatidate phosphatase APP1